MPLGSKHDETGWLQDSGPAAARRLVGARVRVNGTRGEFDLLDVARIEALRG
jgi:hypothetical protein